jgi:hypothetical protein
MENAPLREKIKAEHMRASMAAVQDRGELGKAAPADALQDDVSPGSAHDELNELVMTRMKNEPRLSYQQAFTREYLHEDNRPLKARVDAESFTRSGVRRHRRSRPIRHQGIVMRRATWGAAAPSRRAMSGDEFCLPRRRRMRVRS